MKYSDASSLISFYFSTVSRRSETETRNSPTKLHTDNVEIRFKNAPSDLDLRKYITKIQQNTKQMFQEDKDAIVAAAKAKHKSNDEKMRVAKVQVEYDVWVGDKRD